jgi:hypothetical protein
MGLGGNGLVCAGAVGGCAECVWHRDLSLQGEAEREGQEVRRVKGRKIDEVPMYLSEACVLC